MVALFLTCRFWQVSPSMAISCAAIRLTVGSQGSFQINQQPQEYYMKNQTPDSKSNTQPVHKIRHGIVSASIWCQETDKGQMFNVTFQRAYKDGDSWKNSTSFGRNNLLVVSLIAARAFEWIGNQPRQPKR
jgi:hypothetical protein